MTRTAATCPSATSRWTRCAGVLGRQDPGPQPLLPRRRDGDHDRCGQGVRLQDQRASTTRSRATRSPICWRQTASARRCGPTGTASRWKAYDGIKENIPLVHNAGACAIVHSDDPNGIQRLNQEAAKALADGRRIGHQHQRRASPGPGSATNPAKALGIADKTGSLKAGKMADVVLWNGNPFSAYARPERVWIDGALMYDAAIRSCARSATSSSASPAKET